MTRPGAICRPRPAWPPTVKPHWERSTPPTGFWNPPAGAGHACGRPGDELALHAPGAGDCPGSPRAPLGGVTISSEPGEFGVGVLLAAQPGKGVPKDHWDKGRRGHEPEHHRGDLLIGGAEPGQPNDGSWMQIVFEQAHDVGGSTQKAHMTKAAKRRDEAVPSSGVAKSAQARPRHGPPPAGSGPRMGPTSRGGSALTAAGVRRPPPRPAGEPQSRRPGRVPVPAAAVGYPVKGSGGAAGPGSRRPHQAPGGPRGHQVRDHDG